MIHNTNASIKDLKREGSQETLVLHIGNKVGIHVDMHYDIPGSGRKSYSLFANITPEYDECVFIKNGHSVEDYKELIIFADYEPNYKDLEFKYDSLSSLMKDSDKEFKNRYVKYKHANSD